ncbi:substrate binding domain-containing protein [Sorangium sp. So ce1000]|uniref:substrate binding domain-containing protein n=1 Tax=Sorangium sp. So ce1000 TaxID=3133325 RepID=UPI003F630A55
MVARKVGELHLQFYASPAYLAARGTPRTLDDLAGHDCVVLTGTSPFGRDDASRARARLRARWLANDGFFAREAVRHGVGIGLLPAFLVQQDVLAGALVRVLPRWKAPTGGVFLVFPSGQHLPRKTVALRDHVVEALRVQLQARAGRVGEG